MRVLLNASMAALWAWIQLHCLGSYVSYVAQLSIATVALAT